MGFDFLRTKVLANYAADCYDFNHTVVCRTLPLASMARWRLGANVVADWDDALTISLQSLNQKLTGGRYPRRSRRHEQHLKAAHQICEANTC